MFIFAPASCCPGFCDNSKPDLTRRDQVGKGNVVEKVKINGALIESTFALSIITEGLVKAEGRASVIDAKSETKKRK